MVQQDRPVRDDFVKKKKIGPDKLEEAKPGDRLKLYLTLERLRMVIYFIMNIVLDFLKRYESQKPIYRKIADFLKAIAEVLRRLINPFTK